MRFVPHSDVSFQFSNDPVSYDYSSEEEFELGSEIESGSDLEFEVNDNRKWSLETTQHHKGLETSNGDVIDVDSNTSSTTDSFFSIDEMEKLSDLLSNHGLENRFNLVSNLVDQAKTSSASQINPKGRSSPDSRINYDNFDPKATESRSNVNADPLLSFFVSQFSNERTSRNNAVSNLLKEEEERLRKIEEARRRKIEEEKRKREEEERKIREEAERKRLEEEKRLKAIEEEKQRKIKEERERLEKLKKEQELKLKKEKEELAARKQREIELAKENEAKTIFKPAAVEESYMKYVQNTKDIQLQILDQVKQNPTLKKLVGSHKRKINPKFGQLTNSQEQLTKITNDIHLLILETQQDQLAYKWILNFVSDAIISQAETEVSVKPQSGVALAKLTLNLLILFEDLSYFLLTKFYIACPFLLGYTCSLHTEEERLRMGWKKDEDSGKWENDIQHNERLSGICALYSIMTRLKLDNSYIGYNSQSTKHPLPISKSWIFLARMMDIATELVTETHFVLVGTWWDACANELIQAYGKQAHKLLTLVSSEWSYLGEKSSAGKVRIKLLAEEWAQGAMKSFPSLEE